MKESSCGCGSQVEPDILYGEVKQCVHMCKEIDKANKQLYLFLHWRRRPVDDSSDLDSIHLNLVVQYDYAQVLNFGLFKLTLLWL
jgi:hypothetical protein